MFDSHCIHRLLFTCLLLLKLFPFTLQADDVAELAITKNAYMEQRNEWILQNQKMNMSSRLVLTDDERKLDVHLKKIVSDFRNKFIASNLFCPARNFLKAKTCVESSPLFKILKKMPKGGLLHIHTGSTGSARVLVEMACSDENCYMYLGDDGPVINGTMNFFPRNAVPEGYQSMKYLAAKDANFVEKVISMISMTPADSFSHNPWDKFDACFDRIKLILQYKPVFIEYYTKAFEVLCEDNIQFVEVRAGIKELRSSIDLHDINGRPYSRHEVIELYRTIMQSLQVKYPDFKLKLIISNQRSGDLSEEKVLLEEAFKLRAENPDLIAGYDLVGDESTGHTTLYFLDNLLSAASVFAKKYNIDLPYFFHDGESDWENDSNLFDAILLQSKRIGHGFNLFYFPWLIGQIKKQDICLEICPISNQLLGYVNDLRIHPAANYMRQGVPCVIGSDDPMVLSTSGLSYDFWEVIMAWDLSLADIKQFCINSINYSTLNAKEKQDALNKWQNGWNAFVKQTLLD